MAQADIEKKVDPVLVSQLAAKVNELAESNKTVKSMDYFYNFAKMMYTWRADEIAEERRKEKR